MSEQTLPPELAAVRDLAIRANTAALETVAEGLGRPDGSASVAIVARKLDVSPEELTRPFISTRLSLTRDGSGIIPRQPR